MRMISPFCVSTRTRTPHCVQQPRQLLGLTTWPGWVVSWPLTGSMRNSGVSELPRVALGGAVPALPVSRPLAPLATTSP